MSVHNIVSYPTRLSQNLKSAFHIVQFRPEAENIDNIDRMTELAQLLCLLPHESSVPSPLRTGIHVRNKEDSHDSAWPSLTSAQPGSPFASAIASLYSFTVSSIILVIENSRLNLSSPASSIRLAIS